MKSSRWNILERVNSLHIFQFWVPEHFLPVAEFLFLCLQVTDTSDEMQTKEDLDEQMRAVMDKYKYKRRQIRELQEDLQVRPR